jgi:hypothetical protein
MKRLSWLSLCCLVLLIAAVYTSPIRAKGPADKAILTGPGIDSGVEITDLDVLTALGFGSLESFERGGLPMPTSATGTYYELVRYLKEGDDFIAWDRLRYYPQTADQYGNIFYVGLESDDMWSEFDGKWYTARPDGDAAMRKLIAAYAKPVSTVALTAQQARHITLATALIDAYNAGDLDTVTAHLSDSVIWRDCDYDGDPAKYAVELTGKRKVTDWLRARLQANDQLTLGTLDYDMTSATVRLTFLYRDSQTIRDLHYKHGVTPMSKAEIAFTNTDQIASVLFVPTRGETDACLLFTSGG